MELESLEFADYDTSKIPAMGKNLDTIFQYNEDVDKTAFLNWRTGFACTSRRQFVIIGEAFFSTAYNLTQQCILDNHDKKADSWIFPIMFNVVHGIEVYLKAINAVLSFIAKVRAQYPNATMHIGMIGASNDAAVKTRLQ